MTDWGQILSDIIAESGVSQRKVALMSGVNRASVRKLIRGGTLPISLVERIFDVLGYELDAIKVVQIQNAVARPKRKQLIRIPLRRARDL